MSILAARAARHTSLRSPNGMPLSDGQIMQVAPSIFADAPHHTRSSRYAYIPTVDVLKGLQTEGFQPFMVAQAVVRNKDKQEHTRHLIRLRHADTIANADAAHEIILLNSHDGTSSYQMLAGAFRFVCMNGLVCGDVEHNIRIPHKGRDAIDNVIEGAFTVLDNTKENGRIMQDMRERNMSQREAEAFAHAAIAYRFGNDAAGNVNEVITPRQALQARRHEDNGTDQWSIFNAVQENLIRGGMMGRSTNNRQRQVREITGMDKDTKLNSALWTMMQHLRGALGHN